MDRVVLPVIHSHIQLVAWAEPGGIIRFARPVFGIEFCVHLQDISPHVDKYQCQIQSACHQKPRNRKSWLSICLEQGSVDFV